MVLSFCVADRGNSSVLLDKHYYIAFFHTSNGYTLSDSQSLFHGGYAAVYDNVCAVLECNNRCLCKERLWVDTTSQLYAKQIYSIHILLIVMMMCVSPFVYRIWIGDKAIVPLSMTVLVGFYEFVLICSTRYSFVLNGLGKLKLQLYVTIAAAVAYFPFAILLLVRLMI